MNKNFKSIKNTILNNEKLIAFIFLAPWLIGLFMFALWPFIESFILSLHRTNLFQSTFVGLDNYRNMFSDWRFSQSVWVTLKYVFLALPLRLVFALFVAMLLKDQFKGVGIFRSVTYLPSLLGGSVAVAAMWAQLFGARGLLNQILDAFNIQGKNWIADPDTALFALVALAVWQFGSSMIVFLSGLKNIPNSLYESSEVDGANKIQQFFSITLPMLSPVILFNVILQTITIFQVFTQAFIITRGGPMGETNFLVLYIYNKAFTGSEMGYASAMGWGLLVLIAVTTGLLFLSSKYWVYYENK